MQQPTLGFGLYHAADDSVIPVLAADQLAAAYRAAAKGAEGAEERPRFVRYQTAPGPPITEFQELLGHGSYELAFRDADLYAWLLSHKCHRRAVRRSMSMRSNV